MKEDYRNHVLPQYAAMLVHHFGFRDALSAHGVGLFDVDVLSLNIPFGKVYFAYVFFSSVAIADTAWNPKICKFHQLASLLPAPNRRYIKTTGLLSHLNSFCRNAAE